MAGRGDRKLKKFAEALALGLTPYQMHGWNASEKTNLSGELKIRRVERIIVEPKN